MKKNLFSLLLSLGLIMAFAAIPATAQTAGEGGAGGGGAGGGGGGRGRGNVEQFRQQRMERIKTELGANEDEWKVLQPKIEKLDELRMQGFAGRGFGGRRGGNRGGDNNATPATPDNPVSKASAELRTTLENKEATPEQIKEKLAALRDARAKAKEELTKAQNGLREVITVRQEAVLVSQGILD